jgi:hypothetical protein
VTGKSHEPMGNITRTAALWSDVIVTTTDDRITIGTMTARSSSTVEANVPSEHRNLLKSPAKPGSLSVRE